MDPVLSRKLFSPQAQTGTGIGSLVPEQEKRRAAALYSVARATDDFSKEVQGAQDYEQLMQAIRGDSATIEDRRRELAGIVGVADAERTPVSVLTVLQPAVEMLTQGGIAGLAEDPNATIPGEEPAMMEAPVDQPVQAFAQGGYVQRYADGGPVEPETTGAVTPTARPNPEFNQLFNQYNQVLQQQLGERRTLEEMVRQRQDLFGPDTAPVNANLALMKFGAQVASTPGGLLQALAKPMPALADDLGKIGDQRLARDRAVKMGALEASEKDRDRRIGVSVDAAKQAFTEYNTRIRDEQQRAHQFQLQLNSQTHQANQNELQRDFTANENELQRQQQSKENRLGRTHQSEENRLGRTHQSEEKALDRATTIGEGEANRQASRESQERQLTFQEKQQRLGQDHSLEIQRRQIEATGTEAEKQRVFQERAQEKEFKQRTQQMLDGARVQANMAGYELYVDPANPRGSQLAVRKTPDGIVRADNGQPVPGNFVPYNESTRSIMGLENKDFKEAKPYIGKDGTIYMGVQQGGNIYIANSKGQTIPPDAVPYDKSQFKTGDAKPYVVEDPNAPLGLRQVDAYDIEGRLYERVDGKLVPMEGVKSYKGDLNSMIDITKDGKTTKYTPRVGTMSGQTYEVQASGTNQGINERAPSPKDIQQRTQGLTVPGVLQQRDSALQNSTINKFSIKVEDVGTVGPFAKVMPAPTASGQMLNDKEREIVRQKIENREQLLTHVDDYLKATLKGTGPYNNLNSILNNTLGALGAKSFEAADVEVAKQALEQLRNAVRESETLSRQYAVSEMKIIDQMIADPDKFWSNPQTAMLRLQEQFRATRNDLERDKARLAGTPYVQIERIPLGTKNDAFDLRKPGTAQYLEQQAKSGIDLTGVHIINPKGELVVVPGTNK